MGREINTNNGAEIDFDRRMVKEGVRVDASAAVFPSGYTFNGTQTPEANGQVVTPSTYFYSSDNNVITKCRYIRSIDGSTSAPCAGRLRIGASIRWFDLGPRLMTAQIGAFAYPRDIATWSVHGLIQAAPPDNKILAKGSVEVYECSIDQSYSAKKTALFIGDSNTDLSAIMNPSSGIPASGLTANDGWSFKVRNWYNRNRQDVRVIFRAFAGQGSVIIETLRKNGGLLMPEPPSIVFYNMGTNDTADIPTFTTNINNFVTWASSEWPLAKIVILGSISAQNSAKEALLVSVRAAAQSAVVTADNPNVIFINGGLVPNGSDNSMYSGTEAAGSGIHYGVTGHTGLANYVISEIETNYPSFKTL